MPEIYQVTTRSKGEQSEWEVQEAVRKATKQWVEEANNNNVARMLQESVIYTDKLESRLVEQTVATITTKDKAT